MIKVEPQTGVRSQPLLPMETRLGPVKLAVRDRDMALALWRDVVGLSLIEFREGALQMGVGDQVLVRLVPSAKMPVMQQTLGLYHVAIHVPKRADLAQFVMRAVKRGIRISPTDHLISEAVYLWDGDGNGIEITFETPWRGTLANPDKGGSYATTTDGKPHSGREAIDLDDLLGELGPNPQVEPLMAPGTRIGHVHLHVRNLETSMEFYRDLIGFGGLFLIRSFGMGDVGLNYMPHTIAFNIWAGPNAMPSSPQNAGLRYFTIVVPSADVLTGIRTRLTKAKVAFNEIPGGIDTNDPSNNRMRILVAGQEG